MSAKKPSFFKTYFISVLIISAAVLLAIILGARLFWSRSNIRTMDNVINSFLGKTSLSLSYETNSRYEEKLTDSLIKLNNTEGISANIKLPDGSFMAQIPEDDQKIVERAIEDLPGLIGSEDLLGYTEYQGGVKTFESAVYKGEVTVVIVVNNSLYQIYKDTPLIIIIAVGAAVGAGLLFGLIPAVRAVEKKPKKKN